MASGNQWSSGLCDCFSDCTVCFCTIFCPCVQVGRNAEMITGGETSCCTGCCFYCFLQVCCFGFGCAYTFLNRHLLRTKYNLPERPCGQYCPPGYSHDFCCHCCCFPCATCQESRELKSRGYNLSKGWKSQIGYASPAAQYMAR